MTQDGRKIWTRICIVASLFLCVWVAWPKGENSAPPRPLLIKAALKQADDPIVVLGDSTVAQAVFPRALCGHLVVNAGINGSSTASGLGQMLVKAIGSRQAAMVIVSLGFNDLVSSTNTERYAAQYLMLLRELKNMTSRIAVVKLPNVKSETTGVVTLNAPTIDSYNAALPEVVREFGATLVAMPSISATRTADDIHINPSDYDLWTRSVLSAAENVLCKSK